MPFFNEFFEFVDVFEGWRHLEARVEVDADALFDGESVERTKGAKALGIVGTYATAEQEGRVAMIGAKDAPIKLAARATRERGGSDLRHRGTRRRTVGNGSSLRHRRTRCKSIGNGGTSGNGC